MHQLLQLLCRVATQQVAGLVVHARPARHPSTIDRRCLPLCARCSVRLPTPTTAAAAATAAATGATTAGAGHAQQRRRWIDANMAPLTSCCQGWPRRQRSSTLAAPTATVAVRVGVTVSMDVSVTTHRCECGCRGRWCWRRRGAAIGWARAGGVHDGHPSHRRQHLRQEGGQLLPAARHGGRRDAGCGCCCH